MIQKITSAIRYLSLAKVAEGRDKRILSKAAAEILNEITNRYIKDPNILNPLEKKLRLAEAMGEFDDDIDDYDSDVSDMDEDEDEDDYDDSLDDEDEDDLIDTEIVDDFEEPMLADDGEDEEDVVVVDEDSDAEDIEDDEEDSGDEEDTSDEEDTDDEASSEASFIPEKVRRKAIATANRLAATGDPKTRKLARGIIRRIAR